MQLDRVTAVVRPRSAWEAIDLGFGLARAHWRAVWGAWCLTALPPLLLLWALLGDWPLVPMLLAWWVKPLLGVVPLHLLSRALFGAAPDARGTLRSWPGLWLRHLLAALFVWRLDPRRTFRAPVWVLEGLRGRARRRRLHVLGQRDDIAAVGLTCAMVLLELCWFLAALVALGLFSTLDAETVLLGLGQALIGGEDAPAWAFVMLGCAHLVGLSLAEPCYVAAGFALYINRRVLLEGWDLELAFRQLARRLEREKAAEVEVDRLARAASARLAQATGLLLLVACGLWAAPARAQAEPDPERVARTVLEDPVFGGPRKVQEWRWKGAREEEEPDEREDRVSPAAAPVAGVLRVLLIAGVGQVLVVIVFQAVRARLGERERTREARAAPPTALMGLDLRPESLPADVPGEARALWERGEHAPALSLLYRGALARLVHSHELTLPASATEGDCLQAVREARGPAAWFARLTAAWQAVAYSGRTPEGAEVLALCDEWGANLPRRGRA